MGEPYTLELNATDSDDDPLTYALEPGAPTGAEVVPPVAPYHAEFRWTPTSADVGKLVELHFTVSDGTTTVPQAARLRVFAARAAKAVEESHESPRDDWESYAMPGLSGTLMVPASQGTWGLVGGPSFQMLIAGWIHSNDNYGPSHGRIFVDFGVLGSSAPGVILGMLTNLGVDLSIERNPGRTFLVPFYGLEVGVMIHRALEGGAVAMITPNLGVHLFSRRNIFISASVGYQLPVSARYFDELRGVRPTLSCNFSFW